MNVRWIVMLLLSSFCVNVSAETLRSEEPEVVKLVTGEDYFPFAHNRVPGGGWSKALVTAVFEKMGLGTETDILPWSRGLMWAGEGRYLGTYPYVYSDTRNEQFLYSQPINQVPVRIYVARNSGITKLEHLQDKRLCMPHGYSSEGIYVDLVQSWDMQMSRAQDGMACIRQVEKGWSDVGLTNGYMTNDVNRKRFGIDADLVILPHELDAVPLYFLISRRYADAEQWMRRFNSALESLTQNGEKQQIDEKYRQWLSQ